MTTAKTSTAKKSTNKSAPATSATKKAPTKKSSVKNGPAKKSAAEGNHCWPGFQPTPGKKAGEKGSCEPEPGVHSKATKKATQKAAAASKLENAGRSNPKK
jgi:RNA polymerase primary sigma factor